MAFEDRQKKQIFATKYSLYEWNQLQQLLLFIMKNHPVLIRSESGPKLIVNSLRRWAQMREDYDMINAQESLYFHKR